MIQVKRIYDEPVANGAYRVLVDRLWPRGVGRERAAIDLWLKGIAPSPNLRTWFDHTPERFAEFGYKYNDELLTNPAVKVLFEQAADNSQNLTLLYAAKDSRINHTFLL